jgi:hypothetical protein
MGRELLLRARRWASRVGVAHAALMTRSALGGPCSGLRGIGAVMAGAYDRSYSAISVRVNGQRERQRKDNLLSCEQ